MEKVGRSKADRERVRAIAHPSADRAANAQGANAFDQSPRVAAQRKAVTALQESPAMTAQRSRSRAAFGPQTVGESAVQLKPLSSKVLNVVGEDHDESELPGRRKTERLIAKKVADGDYWTESEFKARDLGFFENIGESMGVVDDDRQAADPMVLRAHYACAFAGNSARRLLQWHGGTDPAGIDEAAANKAAVLDAVKSSCTSVAAGLMLLKQFNAIGAKSEERGNLTEGETAAVSALIDLGINQLDPVVSLGRKLHACDGLVALHAELGKELDLIQQIKDTLDQHMPALLMRSMGSWGSEYKSENTARPLTGTAPSRFLRSMAMGSVAGGRKKTKGVWKIGSNHVTDIVNQQSHDAYNLLTRQEFNDEYAQDYKLPLKT